MKEACDKTLIVMGGVFLITLILNSFMKIDFYNSSSTISYFVFALVYFLLTLRAEKKKA